jgi:endonuclease YncB( thermonuclease family)
MLYNYEAIVERVIDGDTIKLDIDLGFTIHWKSSCRLYGINAPELKSKIAEVREAAKESRQYLIDNLQAGSTILIQSRELDKYGRPLVEVFFGEGLRRNLNAELLSNNLAVKYMP